MPVTELKQKSSASMGELRYPFQGQLCSTKNGYCEPINKNINSDD